MNFQDLVGHTILALTVDEHGAVVGIKTDRGEYVMFHVQDCCESVGVDSVTGDPQAMVGHVINSADVATNEESSSWGDSLTWTFYRLATHGGDVCVRWRGESNGYYSEEVDFAEVGSEYFAEFPHLPGLPLTETEQ